jgi:hypothetical protein
LEYLSELFADALTDAPLLLVFLELFKDTDKALAFVLAENRHDLGHVFYHS